MENLEKTLEKQGYVLKQEINLPETQDHFMNKIYPDVSRLKNYIKDLGFREEYVIQITFKENKYLADIYTKSL